MAPGPRTTAQHQDSEESLTSVGQRAINVMWERTHRELAVAVMGVYLFLCVLDGVAQVLGAGDAEIPPSLAGIVGYVVGSYFSRTNHERVGGVSGKREGR